MMQRKAIVIAANPNSPRVRDPDIGRLEPHIKHQKEYGAVFWDVFIAGLRDTQFKHPDIKVGYFYEVPKRAVEYKTDIEYIKRIKEIIDVRERRFIPDCRRGYWDDVKQEPLVAVKIVKFHRLLRPYALNEFYLWSTANALRRVQNYVIVRDPGYT